ncbi:hypothetical protein N7451_004142 [Penicillium sp. IBT 35674x]|nr:hypothetical protein N7451_004142 [Penicillium sp. IBT 35674x]
MRMHSQKANDGVLVPKLPTHLRKTCGLQEIESEFGASALRLLNYCHPHSALRLSVSAFALAKFGQAVRSDGAMENAEVVYGRSIKRMQVEIASLSSETIDQLLVATLLMGVYDNITIPNRGDADVGTPLSIDKLEGSKDGVQTRPLIELLDGQSCGRVYFEEFQPPLGFMKKWKTLVLMIQ